MTNITKQKIISLIIHISAIFMLFILPEIVMKMGDKHHDFIPFGVFAKTLICIIVFYINYLYLFDYCFNRSKSTLRFVIYNTILFIGAMTIIYISWIYTAAGQPIHSELPPPPHFHDNIDSQIIDHSITYPDEVHYFFSSLSRFLRDAIILILTIALCLAIKLSKRWATAEQHQNKQIAAQREEELQNLKSQINPHFLFNTLNSIYALIDICPKKAKQAIHELSHMLRYVIYENPQTVTLKQEVDFIVNYIELMKLRLGNKYNLNINIDIDKCEDIQIAPLMFITIIENVFKHGNTGNANDKISISITAKNGIIKCHTSNSFIADNTSESNGIGLKNLRQRIKLIYGDNANLESVVSDNIFSTELTINLNKQT